jgi:hypothetical protein
MVNLFRYGWQNRLASWAAFLCIVLAFSGSSLGDDESAKFYEHRNWQKLSGEGVNISSFVYRDVNRNGLYDMGDRPMAAVAFELWGPNGKITRRSNISGVANYKMSATFQDHAITKPGTYVAKLHVPPGWSATSNNPIQSAVFEYLPGAPADLVALNPFEPIGLAPVLSITGRVKRAPGDGAPHIVQLISPRGQQQKISLGDDGRFQVNVEPGQWTIEVKASQGNKSVTRTVEVTQAPVILSTISLDLKEVAPLPKEQLVDFEKLVTSSDIYEIPQGYDGVGWRYFVATHNRNYAGEGYINSTISGEYVAYNASGHPIAITNSPPVDFVGGYFGLAWLNSEGETLLIRGWRNDELIYEDEIPLSSLGPVYFSADFRSVTRIELASRHYWQFVCDDLTFRFMR